MIMAKVNFKNLTKLKLALNFIRDKIKRTSSIKHSFLADWDKERARCTF